MKTTAQQLKILAVRDAALAGSVVRPVFLSCSTVKTTAQQLKILVIARQAVTAMVPELLNREDRGSAAQEARG